MILVHLHEPVTMDDMKRTVEDIEYMVPEQIIRDAMGNIHKKCEPANKLEATTLIHFFSTYKDCFDFSFRC